MRIVIIPLEIEDHDPPQLHFNLLPSQDAVDHDSPQIVLHYL